jgi:Peptidase M15
MSPQLSPHFSRGEFEKDGPFPDDCLPVVANFCNAVLEPFRIKFGEMDCTSGYRDPAHNIEVHGVLQSQHQYTPIQCAGDFLFKAVENLRDVFDWARLDSYLPIDQLILEHGVYGSILHISYTLTPPRREALEGLTGNRSGYTRWKFVAAPPLPSIQNS